VKGLGRARVPVFIFNLSTEKAKESIIVKPSIIDKCLNC